MTPPAHRHVLVGGRPQLLLGGGQLHNSTSSDLDRARAAFDRVVAMGGNAVTTTVSWHLVEPVEGSYDFSGVDPLVDMARERGLALTLLWFGRLQERGLHLRAALGAGGRGALPPGRSRRRGRGGCPPRRQGHGGTAVARAGPARLRHLGRGLR